MRRIRSDRRLAQLSIALAFIFALETVFCGEKNGYSPELQQELQSALILKGPAYKPRIEHLLSGGRSRYTNRLILEDSPYLLQHAHNPVDWYSWGDAAFAKS